MSPEVYQGMPYAFSTDVWSFAVVVFEMIVGRVSLFRIIVFSKLRS